MASQAGLAFHAGHGLADFLAWNLGGEDSLGPWAAVVVFVPGLAGGQGGCVRPTVRR